MFKIIVNNNGTNLNMTLCMVWIGVVGGGVCHHLYEYVIVKIEILITIGFFKVPNFYFLLASWSLE
jgi:hypothetical protein